VLFGCILVGALFACSDPGKKATKQEVAFVLNDSTRAIFPVAIQPGQIELLNGEETLTLFETNDSTFLVPVFGGSWSIPPGDNQGRWVDSLRSSNYQVQLQLQNRLGRTNKGHTPTGTWSVWFGEADSTLTPEAQFDLDVQGEGVKGTFRTPTGDYRYFSGYVEDGRLRMQTYDGAHLYYIEAQLLDGEWVNGNFYSGNHYHTTWLGKPAKPSVSDEVVRQVQPEQELLTASVYDQQGNPMDIKLIAQENEVLVVDILGTWCPNCMDEVRLLHTIQNENQHVRVISIAFERDTVPNHVFERFGFYRSQLDINWDIYWGGKANKSIAASAFPFLDEVVSFPTTLFIRSNGSVSIHQGFNGPATGLLYENEVRRFNELVAL
jgi:thiol-disulfide isomerase/thioredoxin